MFIPEVQQEVKLKFADLHGDSKLDLYLTNKQEKDLIYPEKICEKHK
jgi:hypothetical protein